LGYLPDLDIQKQGTEADRGGDQPPDPGVTGGGLGSQVRGVTVQWPPGPRKYRATTRAAAPTTADRSKAVPIDG
jgi:hypothetical protein